MNAPFNCHFAGSPAIISMAIPSPPVGFPMRERPGDLRHDLQPSPPQPPLHRQPRHPDCTSERWALTRPPAAVRAGLRRDTQHGAVVPPLHLSSNFTFAGFAQPRTDDYTCSGNPTRDLLGGALAEAEGGAGAVITSTGMSAIALVLQLVQPGDLVVAPFDCYGGSHRLFSALARKGAFRLIFADLSDEAERREALARRPRLVGSRPPAIPCCGSPTSPRSPPRRPSMARWWWPTTPSSRRPGSSRSRWAPTWWSTRPPNT